MGQYDGGWLMAPGSKRMAVGTCSRLGLGGEPLDDRPKYPDPYQARGDSALAFGVGNWYPQRLRSKNIKRTVFSFKVAWETIFKVFRKI